MALWTFTTGSKKNLFDGTLLLATDSFKMALFLGTSNLGASSTTYAGVTNEVANANGYTTGGQAITFTESGTGTVTVAPSSTSTAWTASGGSITARFAAIYEVGGNVLAFLDFGSNQTATDTNNLIVTSSSGIFTAT